LKPYSEWHLLPAPSWSRTLPKPPVRNSVSESSTWRAGPGTKGGVSHNPDEWSSKEDCAHGANVLYHTVLNLAIQH
jgi:hypothetical protein